MRPGLISAATHAGLATLLIVGAHAGAARGSLPRLQSGPAEPQPFTLTLENPRVDVGSIGVVLVSIRPAAGLRCNSEYPHQIQRLAASEGAELTQNSVRGGVQDGAIVFEVGVKPRRRGRHAVTGLIRFSVCSDNVCHIKKVPLEATVTGL